MALQGSRQEGDMPPAMREQQATIEARIEGLEAQITEFEQQQTTLRGRIERARFLVPTLIQEAETLDHARAEGARARLALAERKIVTWAAVTRAHTEIAAATTTLGGLDEAIGERRAALKDLTWRARHPGSNVVRLG